MAKLLASQAAWEAANACLDAYGGYGFARDYDVERKFREDQTLHNGAGEQQPGAELHRPERPGHAAATDVLFE